MATYIKTETQLQPFASIDDLRQFCGDLTDETRATSLLEYTSNYLRQIARNNNVDIDTLFSQDALVMSNIKYVVMSAIKRALAVPASMPSSTGYSITASPYSQSVTGITNPDDTIYFKGSELKLLGLASVGGRSQFNLLRGAL